MSLDGSAAMAWHVASVSRGGGEQRNAGEMGFRFLKYLQRKNEHGWACRILFWLFWFRQIRLGLLALAGFNTFQNMFGWCARMWFNDVAPSSPKKKRNTQVSATHPKSHDLESQDGSEIRVNQWFRRCFCLISSSQITEISENSH
jgi:hypothetical protein